MVTEAENEAEIVVSFVSWHSARLCQVVLNELERYCIKLQILNTVLYKIQCISRCDLLWYVVWAGSDYVNLVKHTNTWNVQSYLSCYCCGNNRYYNTINTTQTLHTTYYVLYLDPSVKCYTLGWRQLNGLASREMRRNLLKQMVK